MTKLRNTAYAAAVERLLALVSAEVFGAQAPDKPIRVVIAGGAAAHLYTGQRVSKDLDVEILARMLKPEVVISYRDDDGTHRTVHLDRAYTTTLGVMHKDYLDRVRPTGLSAPGFDVTVLAPVDLAISKIARWADHDREDVRSLIGAGLLQKAEFEKLAVEALSYYVGNTQPVRAKLAQALGFFLTPHPRPRP